MRLLICAPDIFSGDAVGNHCRGIARAARRLGMTANLYAQRYDTGGARVHALAELFTTVRPDDIVLLSYSIFDPDLERIAQLNCRKICYFHGVTTPDLLRAFEPRTAQLCEDALGQLPMLAGFDVLIANSLFSAQALAQVADPASIEIIPPVVPDMYPFRRGGAPLASTHPVPELLVVGRVVPHKRIEDAIEIVHALRESGTAVRLSIVGSTPNFDYSKFLINHARKLGVLDAVDFRGVLDDADLLDRFERCAMLLVTSRHEGFCVPVLEAMQLGKPVLVRGGTAAEELCPRENVLAADASINTWAEAAARLLTPTQAQRDQSSEHYRNHAGAILARTADDVWRSMVTRLTAENTK
ncbi:glycosyltransferase [Paraburkholderia sp. Ac-20347]|uniref:glycosyltransferase family 4 protein n=1 Tax=Paraburkholderia sp. Ac-20347 TaxID=2703892 RepID=UPI00197E6D05|nr:glycosyltransferase [Paraburkholderia sp. Ac-20347]MBN3808169.1 glycosyltransferase [Paraburkholderia sp. Ac-20347]